jgi:exopolysaccharide production protein ExoQ
LMDTDLSVRNETLTGRGEIWLTLMTYVEQNPIFGAGFGSFWNIGSASPIFGLTTTWVSTLTQGHNGYIDLAVTIGIPGVVLCVAAFNVVPLIRAILGPKDPYGPVWMGSIIFSILNNMTESGFLATDMPSWFFLLFSLSAMGLRREAESPKTVTTLAADPNAIDAMLRPSIDMRRPSF